MAVPQVYCNDNLVGAFANRPAPNTVGVGTIYHASDQDLKYIATVDLTGNEVWELLKSTDKELITGFTLTGIAVPIAGVAFSLFGFSSSPLNGQLVARPGSITAFTVQLGAALAVGTLTFTVTKNAASIAGTAQTLAPGATTAFVIFPSGSFTFVAGDRIGVQATASVLTVALNSQASVEIQV